MQIIHSIRLIDFVAICCYVSTRSFCNHHNQHMVPIPELCNYHNSILVTLLVQLSCFTHCPEPLPIDLYGAFVQGRCLSICPEPLSRALPIDLSRALCLLICLGPLPIDLSRAFVWGLCLLIPQ